MFLRAFRHYVYESTKNYLVKVDVEVVAGNHCFIISRLTKRAKKSIAASIVCSSMLKIELKR